MQNRVSQEQQRTRPVKDLRATLYAYHAAGTVPFVEVVNASEGEAPCAACKELHGRRFWVEDAIGREILPCRECAGRCRCDYQPVKNQRRTPRETTRPATSWLRRILDV